MSQHWMIYPCNFRHQFLPHLSLFFVCFHFLYDVGKSNSSVFGIQSSHGMIEIATATVTGICFSYIHRLWRESSVCPPVIQCVVLHPHCPSCPVSACLGVLQRCMLSCTLSLHVLFSPWCKAGPGKWQPKQWHKVPGRTQSLNEIAVLLFCEGNTFPVLDWAPSRTGLVGEKWNSFTSSSLLQKPLYSEWYRHCRLAAV